MNIQSTHHDGQLIESRLAARLAAGLSTAVDSLPHDVSERLRFSREQAMSRARLAQRATPAAATVVGLSVQGAAMLGGFVPWWQRVAAILPLAMLIGGLMAIDNRAVREQVVAAADFDAQLLADDLPPAAYSDPGFAEFIRSTPQP
jgi:hypothetical protein